MLWYDQLTFSSGYKSVGSPLHSRNAGAWGRGQLIYSERTYGMSVQFYFLGRWNYIAALETIRQDS
jgi:hypothetical protein